MKASKQAEDNIKHFEQCKLQAYYATAKEEQAKLVTIGWGNTIDETGKKFKITDKITQERADDLFDNKLAQFEGELIPLLTMPLNQNQYDAIVSFVYNIGITQFANSTMLKQLHAGNYTQAGLQFTKWVYQAGHVLNGLVTRRIAERDMYFKGD